MSNFSSDIEQFLAKLPKELAEKIRSARRSDRNGRLNFNYETVQDMIKDLPSDIKSELQDHLYYRKGLTLDLKPVIKRNLNKEIFDENRHIPKQKNYDQEKFIDHELQR